MSWRFDVLPPSLRNRTYGATSASIRVLLQCHLRLERDHRGHHGASALYILWDSRLIKAYN
jgi:hypothetical protein